MKYKIILLLLITIIIVFITPTTVVAEEFIVKGESNLEDGFNVKDSYTIGETSYYVVSLENRVMVQSKNGDISDNKNISKNRNISINDANWDSYENYNIDLIGADDVSIRRSEYEDINIAILDTGINDRHPYLDKVEWETNITTNSVEDKHGHGTHVAGIVGARENSENNVRGVTPGASIYNVKIFNDEGGGKLSDMAEGIIKASRGPDGERGTSDDADIISISGGTFSSFAIKDAVETVTPETLVVASAGNGERVKYPARFNSTISVSSINSEKEVSLFSAKGESIDVAAPGTSIKSLSSNGGYTRKTGTSMAAPHVSASFILYLSKYGKPGEGSIERVLKKSTVDINEEGFDKETGYGLIKIPKMLNTTPLSEIESITPSKSKISMSENIKINISNEKEESRLYYKIYNKSPQNKQFRLLKGNQLKLSKKLIKRNFNELPEKQKVKIRITLVTEETKDTVTKEYLLVKEETKNIELKEFEIKPDNINPGTPIDINIKLKNNGLKEGAFTGRLFIQNKPNQKLNRTIKPGEKVNIDKRIKQEETGDYMILLYSNQIKNRHEKIEVRENRNIKVKEFDFERDEIKEKQKANMVLKMKNKQKRTLTPIIKLLVDQKIKDKFKIKLKPKQEREINKELNLKGIGTKNITIKSQLIGYRLSKIELIRDKQFEQNKRGFQNY